MLMLACVASVPERRERNSGRAKNGARAKRWKERGGGGERRFPPFPSPTRLLPLFCSRLIFRAARMRKNSFARPEFRSRGTGTLATQAMLMKLITTTTTTIAVVVLYNEFTYK